MAGVVHFSQILRWAENAESDFFRARGLAFAEKNAGVLAGFPRVKISVEFFAPARYDDEIFAQIRPVKIPSRADGVSVEWEFEISAKTPEGGRKKIAAGAWTTVYALAEIASGTLRRADSLPQKIRAALERELEAE